MNFDFSDDQKQLRDQARRFLSEKSPSKTVREVLEGHAPYDRELWKSMGELGFLGVAIPQEYGGAGAGHLELAVLAEEIGRANAAIPMLSSIYLMAETIMLAGSEEQKHRWLPRLASGEAIGTFALFEGSGGVSPKSVQTVVSKGRLDGLKSPVPNGAIADVAIVAARTGTGQREIGLFLVDLRERGVQRKMLQNIDPSRQQAEIRFENAAAEPIVSAGKGWDVLTQILDRAAILIAFEQLGGADRTLEMARDYALDRMAFGRPIGSSLPPRS